MKLKYINIKILNNRKLFLIFYIRYFIINLYYKYSSL